MRLRLFILVLTPVMMVSAASGQTGGVEADIFVSRDTLLIGDPFTISLEVRRSEGYQYVLPELRVNLLPLELEEPELVRERGKGGVSIERLEFTSFAFDTGMTVIPSQKIIYWQEADTSARSTAFTDSVWIYIASVLTTDAADIRDIKEPFEIEEPFRYLWALLILLVIAGAVTALYYYSRKLEGKPVTPFRKPEKIRPAHEVALEALKELKGQGLLEKGKVSDYYIALSRILRQYIEDRYFIRALEMTTRELLEVIEARDSGDKVAVAVRRVLTDSDLVKFARQIPSYTSSEAAFDETFELVEKTKIAPITEFETEITENEDIIETLEENENEKPEEED